VALVVAWAASACDSSGATPPPTPSMSASASTEPAEPVPALSCTKTPSAAWQPLVMVEVRDSQRVQVDSFADPAHPVVMCDLTGAASNVKFISATEIGFTYNPSTNDPISNISSIYRMSLLDGRALKVTSFNGEALDVAWSPDGSSVAYLAYTYAPGLGSGDANQLWLKVGRGDPRTLTPLIPLFGRGGSADDQTIVRFSHDGKYLLMVDTYVSGPAPLTPDQATVQVRAMPDGGLVFVPPTALEVSGGKGGPFVTMATWSHLSHRLFYRDMIGVQAWDPGGMVSVMALGVSWNHPSLSPDDRFAAYTVYSGGAPHIEIRELISSSVRVLLAPIGTPILLSDTAMLEAHYAPNQGIGPPYLESGWFALNLQTNEETSLPSILRPIDWLPR